jgi:hypothetical protein
LAYSATLTATGGTPPYTWSIATGVLPAGLTLNAATGAITGTPSVAGTSNFMVRATDSATPATNATRSLSVTISALAGNTGFLGPTAQAPVTSGAGDNNGFQTNPTNAFTTNNSFAVDTNSGSNSSTGCTDTTKDKHDYFTYNLNVPAGATIKGIEVGLVARVNSTLLTTSKMCAQLSWDGGVSWTAAKSTASLTTTAATYTLGGVADTWGRTWTLPEVANNTFRVRLINVANSTARTFSLDSVAVRVTY